MSDGWTSPGSDPARHRGDGGPARPPSDVPVPPPGWGGPPPGSTTQGAPVPPSGSPTPGYGTPQHGAGPQYGAPQYGGPQYGAPTYGAPPSWGPPPAPRPGIVPLRPLGVGDLLDGAFSTVRLYWRSVLALAAVVGVAVTVLGAVAPVLLVTGGTGSEIAAGVVFVLSLLLSAVGSFVIGGALAVVVAQGVLGRPAPLRHVWERLRPRLLPLFGVSLAPFLVVVGLGVLGALAVAAVYAAAGTGAAVAVGLLLGLGLGVVAVWVYVRWLLAGPVVVLEGAGARAGLRRSAELVATGFWRTLGIWLLGTILASVVAGVLQIPFGVVAALAGGASGLAGSDPTSGGLAVLGVNALGQVLSTIITLPFSAAVVALLYVDRRMRREGLDLTLREASARG